MSRFSRRDLLQMGAALAATAGLPSAHGELFAMGLERIFHEQAKVIWIQGMSCSGCSVSFLNADAPAPLEILTQLVSLLYHSTLGAAQGDLCQEVIEEATKETGYVVVMEGSIPLGMPEACVIGEHTLTSLLPPLLQKAQAIVAAGTCASFGGIPAAEDNPTGAVSVQQFMKHQGIPVRNRLINCPGCPVHPQSLVGTLAYFIANGYPPVDKELLTPDMFYKSSVHGECPRFHHWEKREFAEAFGEEGCLFKLGCLGPLSHTACPRRQWNGGVNWCIRAGAPCIACTSPDFAIRKDFPFYRKGEQYHAVDYQESDREG